MKQLWFILLVFFYILNVTVFAVDHVYNFDCRAIGSDSRNSADIYIPDGDTVTINVDKSTNVCDFAYTYTDILPLQSGGSAANQYTLGSTGSGRVKVYKAGVGGYDWNFYHTSSTINATCGTSNGITIDEPPYENRCSTGNILEPVTQSGEVYSWTCEGVNGGTNSSCAAYTSSYVHSNTAPIATDDSVSTFSNIPVTISVLSNDTDIDSGDTLSISSNTTPSNGSVSISGTNLIYTSSASFSGTDTFTYTMSDGTATSTATVTVTVQEIPRLSLKAHGGAMQFDNSQIETNITDLTDSFTWELWYNPRKNGTYRHLFSKYNDGSNFDENEILIEIDDLNKIKFWLANGSSNNAYYSNATLTDNQWYHISTVYNHTNTTAYIYINGILDSTHTGVTTRGDTSFPVKFGAVGIVDEVRIWNTARTQADINSTMNYQLDGNETGLLSYYNFNERIGDNIYDITSNNNDGVKEGNTTRLNFLGDNLSFDGTNDYISLGRGTNDIFAIKDDLSVCSNIKLDSIGSGDAIVVFGADGETSSTNIYYELIVTSTGSLKYKHEYSSGSDFETISDTVLNINQWYYVCMTRDSSSVKMYIDGELDLNASLTSSSSGGSSSSLYFGQFPGSSTDFGGTMSEISIWKKTLTQNEINSYKYSPPNIKDTSLVGYWPLNDGDGSTVYDQSSNGNNGTITGSTWIDNAPLIYGDTLYTSQGIVTTHKLIIENNTTVPTYTYNGDLPNEIVTFNGNRGIFSYVNTNEINTTLDINASTNGTVVNKLFNVIVYENNDTNPIMLNINITNYNSNENNITDIQYIGENNNSESFEVSGSQNLINGDTNISVPVYKFNQDFSLKIDLNDSGSLWYNFNNKQLYTAKGINSDFETTVEDINYSITIDMNSSNIINNTRTIRLKNHGGVIQLDGFFDTGIQDIGNSFTFETWISSSQTGHVFQKWDNSNYIGNQQFEAVLEVDGSRKLKFWISNGTNPEALYSTSTIPQNTWSHIAATYDYNTNETKLYINGNLDSSQTNTYQKLTVASLLTTLKINGENIGILDDIRIWNTARTQSDINSTMNHQLDGNESGLIAYYNFDERIGDIIYDITSNNLEGTIEGNITRINFLGDSLDFNGTNNYVDIPYSNITSLSGNSNFTYSSWIKTSMNTKGVIFGNETSSANQLNFVASIELNNKFSIQIWDSSSGVEQVYSTSIINDNLWHYVSAVKNGNVLKLYIDGIFENSITLSNDTVSSLENNSNFTIGKISIWDSEYFNGSIAQTSLYDTALSQDEIKQNMHSEPDISDSSLMGYWPLNKGSGTTAYDKSSNNNDGIIAGATWIDTAPTIYGNNIYTSEEISITTQLFTENNISTPIFEEEIDNTNIEITNTILRYLSMNMGEDNVIIKDNESTQSSTIKLITYRNYSLSEIIRLNISNLDQSNQSINSVKFIGDKNETVSLDLSFININTDNNLSVYIQDINQNFIVQVETNTSGVLKQWWFKDGRFYNYVDDSFNFTLSDTTPIIVDAISTNWSSNNYRPTTSFIYDRYRTIMFNDFEIAIFIDDLNNESLTYNITIPNNNILDTSGITLSNTLTSDAYKDIPIVLTIKANDSKQTGKVMFTITATDSNIDSKTSIVREFLVIVNDYISTDYKEKISDTTYNNITSQTIDFNNTNIYTTQDDIYKKYNDGVNLLTVNSSKYNSDNTITNNQVISIDNIVSPKRLDSLYYEIDSSNIITQYTDSSKNAKIKEIKYEYNSSMPNEYTLYEKYSMAHLNLYQTVKYSDGYEDINYSSITDFRDNFKTTNNRMGIVRDDLTNTTMLFLDEGDTNGNLIHIDENGTLLSLSAGSWNISTILGKETLILNPDSNSSYKFNYGTAFAIGDTNKIQRGQYVSDSNYNSNVISTRYLNKEAMKTIVDKYVKTPHIQKTINNGWTYVSLPTSMTICDSSIQGVLTGICDQNNTLESVFSSSSISSVLRYSNSWSYWDKNDTINSYYQMDKFSAISASDGVLVKSSVQTSIDLPYDMFNNNTSEFISTTVDEWTLGSVTEDKTVQEIESMIETSNKTLKYILVLRDSWEVYAPDNNSNVDSNLKRITEIKKDESFWILVE